METLDLARDGRSMLDSFADSLLAGEKSVYDSLLLANLE